MKKVIRVGIVAMNNEDLIRPRSSGPRTANGESYDGSLRRQRDETELNRFTRPSGAPLGWSIKRSNERFPCARTELVENI